MISNQRESMDENEQDGQNKYQHVIRSPIINTEQFSTLINKDEAEDLFDEYQNLNQLPLDQKNSQKEQIYIEDAEDNEKSQNSVVNSSEDSIEEDDSKQLSSYGEEHEDQISEEEQEKISRKKKKNKKGKKKLSNEKNFLKGIKIRIQKYLQSFHEDLPKFAPTLTGFTQLFRLPEYKNTLDEMFSSRYLKRQIQLSNIKQGKAKCFYIKKIERLRKSFEKGELASIM